MSQYCNLPVKEVHGKEGEAPAGYSLKSVYVVTRHGDRSPIVGVKSKSNQHLNCLYNSTSHFNIPNFDKFVPNLEFFSSRLHHSNLFPYSLYPNSRVCDSAQLTENGAVQHLLNGWHMHERYVRKWRLFSEPFSPDQVYAKSTGYSRTYQSAIALLYTFLPRFNLTDLNIFRSDNTFFCSEKSLGVSCPCPALSKLKQLSDNESGASIRNSTEWNKIRKYMAYVLNIKRLPWISGIMDSLMVYVCHKIPLPCNSKHECINSSHLAELWRQLDHQGASMGKLEAYQKYAHLGMHPLLHEISQHMILTTKRKAKVKFVLYSGHDVTVTSLLTTLGIDQGHWPMYATRIIFELYSKDEAKTHHFLRVLVNGENFTSKVSFCRGQSNNGFCKLKYFIDFMQKDNLALFKGQTYKQACHSS